MATAAARGTGTAAAPFGWPSIVRLGLAQLALGAIVVLTTSTLNRVMVVELALPAIVPGALVALHHLMQLLRPRMGYGSDLGQRRTPWILGGMTTLAIGGAGAAAATALMVTQRALGLALAVLCFALIGAGVSASGTSLLVLLAKRVAPERRAAAATVVWVMMIFGFAITAGTAGRLLDPFSMARLVAVTSGVSLLAVALTVVAIWGVEGEGGGAPVRDAGAAEAKPDFVAAFRQVWAEAEARRFTIFIFVSMLAYAAQDLILEPFAGARFDFTPGETTRLSGVQHGGALTGMLLVGAVTYAWKGRPIASLKGWTVGGCLASATALLGLAVAGLGTMAWPLRANVFLLGLTNGAFAIAAIGGMMAMASRGRSEREGTRMGLWGASQAIAMGAGGFLGTVLADGARLVVGRSASAYAFVFALEAAAFLVAAALALRIAFDQPAFAGQASGARLPATAQADGPA